MAGMQNIKTAVGGGQRYALSAECLAPGGQGICGVDFILKIHRTNPAVVYKDLSIERARRRFGT
jgi:hypothetical protein